MRVPTFVVFSFLLFAPRCFPQSATQSLATIKGTVSVKESNGGRSTVPGTHITLLGPVTQETESDESGNFVLRSIPIGKYEIAANAPGLEAVQQVEVNAGGILALPIFLDVATVNSNVTVSASDPVQADSAQSGTIASATVETAPNQNERFESLLPLVPGVVRGPDGRINMKGSRSTQSGWLVNSANATDPVTGGEALNLPIDVVSSVQVISNPFDPEYGRFTGAVSSVETRAGNLEKFHFSIQNLVPRARDRDGDIVGIEAFTPRATFTGPLVKDRVAFTQSFEYRFVRTPVNSLPALQRDTKLESFDSFSQLDLKINQQQTATVSFALFPQKLDYLGLNTFTPQPSTPDLHQRGYQASLQHHYLTQSGSLLTSQVAYESFNADLSPNSSDPYRLLVETTEGGFFNVQRRRSDRTEWQETFQSHPRNFFGTHQLKAGLDFSHSSYNGRQQFAPVEIVGTSGNALERISFGAPTTFHVGQSEFAGFAGDEWIPSSRLTIDLGLRFDHDSITKTIEPAPRAGLTLALTGNRRTLLKAGIGVFYDRVPLNIPAFPLFPGRTISILNSEGADVSSTPYVNQVDGPLRNPRSHAWNIEVDQEVLETLLLRVSYQQRNTLDDFILNPTTFGSSGELTLSNSGHDSYREFQVTSVYKVHGNTLNFSYVRSKSYGDLNDFNQFFGNDPEAVIQPNESGRLPFDAPNRFLVWGEIAGPWKLSISPVFDLHTGFPYSVENELREFVGLRNDQRFPAFNSFDLQVLRNVKLPFRGKNRTAKIGIGVFNLFNHFNPRDVQNDLDSPRFGEFFNGTPLMIRGKFVLGF